MAIDPELTTRRTLKLPLKVGESIHSDRKLVVVNVTKEHVEFLALSPHDRQIDAVDSYRAGLARARRQRRARLTEKDRPA